MQKTFHHFLLKCIFELFKYLKYLLTIIAKQIFSFDIVVNNTKQFACKEFCFVLFFRRRPTILHQDEMNISGHRFRYSYCRNILFMLFFQMLFSRHYYFIIIFHFISIFRNYTLIFLYSTSFITESQTQQIAVSLKFQIWLCIKSHLMYSNVQKLWLFSFFQFVMI